MRNSVSMVADIISFQLFVKIKDLPFVEYTSLGWTNSSEKWIKFFGTNKVVLSPETERTEKIKHRKHRNGFFYNEF